MITDKMIQKVADRILKQVEALKSISTTPLEKQIDQVVLDIEESLSDLKNLNFRKKERVAGITLQEQKRMLNLVLSAVAIPIRGAVHLINLVNEAIRTRDVTEKTIDSFERMFIALGVVESEMRKYVDFAHSSEDNQNIKNVLDSVNSLKLQYSRILKRIK